MMAHQRRENLQSQCDEKDRQVRAMVIAIVFLQQTLEGPSFVQYIRSVQGNVVNFPFVATR